MGTPLLVRKTVVCCEDCGTDFVFPSQLRCPRCGSGVDLISAASDPSYPLTHARTPPPAPVSAPAHHEVQGEEPDVWAKRAIWVGIALGLGLIVVSFWPNLGLTGLFEAMALPKMYQPWVRATIFGVGAYANIKGILSLANWTSGYRMYRKLRIPRA